MAESEESTSGAMGRLIGYAKAQRAVDSLAKNLGALDKAIAKATGEIASGKHRATPAPSGLGAAWNGSWTKQGGARPNGGGASFAGQPAATGATAGGGGGGFAASFAGAGLAGGVKALAGFGANKLPSLVANQTNAYQAAQSAPGQSWSQIYKSSVRGNITATDAGDATGAAYSFARSGGMNTTQNKNLLNSITSVGLVDPNVNNTKAVTAASTAWGAQSYNKMRAFGISTIGQGGRLKAPRELANEILRKIPGSDKIKSKANITAGLDSPTGGINQTLQSMINNGLIQPEMEDVVREEIRGILLSRVGGKSFKQYDAAMNAAGRGDKKALGGLKSDGIGGSNLQDTKRAQNAADSRDAEFIDAFSAGVKTGADLLVKFNEALTGFLKASKTGNPLYAGAGAAGMVAPTFGAAVGGVTGAASGVFGGLLAARAVGKIGARALGGARGGDPRPTPAPGSRGAARAGQRAGAGARRAATRAAGRGAAKAAGKTLAHALPFVGTAISAAEAGADVDGRENLAAYYEGERGSSPGMAKVNAFSHSMLNSMSFGLADGAVGPALGLYDQDVDYTAGGISGGVGGASDAADKQGDKAKADTQGGPRTVKLKKPVNAPITSPFSMARVHPITGVTRPHKGVDFGASEGTPILAAGDGTVISGNPDPGGWGNYTLIKHSETLETLYAHQSRKVAQSGAKVSQGQLIGYVGHTGSAKGAHLHFEVHVNGVAKDPMPFLDGTASATTAQGSAEAGKDGDKIGAKAEEVGSSGGLAASSVAGAGKYGSLSQKDVLAGILSGGTGSAPALAGTARSNGSGDHGAETKGEGADVADPGAQTGSGPAPVTGGKFHPSVERWRPMVLDALGKFGASADLANVTLARMQRESDGNPRAINNSDINAKNGNNSRGLMQVIPTTFKAAAFPGYDKDIWDPMSNTLASMRYAKDRYGSLQKAYTQKNGYAKGSWELQEDGPVNVHKGEMIIPARQSETIRQALMKEVNPGAISKNDKSGMSVRIEPGAIVVTVAGAMSEAAARSAGTTMANSLANRLRAIQEV